MSAPLANLFSSSCGVYRWHITVVASAPIVSLPVPWPSECSRADSVKPVQEEGGWKKLEQEGNIVTMVLAVLPMFFDLPTTHAVFPNVSTWHLFNISSTPRGVAGINPGSPVQYRPERKRKWKWEWWYKLTDDINYSISILLLTDICQMEPIHILVRSYSIADSLLVNMWWEGQLYQ